MKNLIYIIIAITLLSCQKNTFKTLSYTIECSGHYKFKQSVNDVRIYQKIKEVEWSDEIQWEVTNKQQKKGDITIVIKWYYRGDLIKEVERVVGGSPKGGIFYIGKEND